MERTIGSASGEVLEHPGHLPENPPKQSDDMHMEFQATCWFQ